MKNFIKFAGVFALLASLASCGIVGSRKTEEPPRTITVTGTGTVSSAPDKASITVSVVTQNWIAETASSENASVMARVRDALLTAGVGANDITTTNFSISRDESWQDGRQVIGRYRVRNSLNIVLRDTNLASAIIDTAIAAGANELNSLRFEVSDTSSLVREARTRAVQDAEAAASLIAGASGSKIGAPVTITENDSNLFSNNVMLRAMPMVADSSVSTPISAGNIVVSSTVTITYALQ